MIAGSDPSLAEQLVEKKMGPEKFPTCLSLPSLIQRQKNNLFCDLWQALFLDQIVKNSSFHSKCSKYMWPLKHAIASRWLSNDPNFDIKNVFKMLSLKRRFNLQNSASLYDAIWAIAIVTLYWLLCGLFRMLISFI